MESVIERKPMFWAAPPANIFAADLSETIVSSLFAGFGGFVISGSIRYLTIGQFDPAQSMAWAGITLGTVLIAPIAGDVFSDVLCNISEAVARGWNRGQPEIEPEQPTPVMPVETTEDERGSARQPGEWWYRTRSGRMCKYDTPLDKQRMPQISDQRMQAIFNLVLRGTPFSEREITERVSGLSGPRFRILQLDWRTHGLYKLNEDRTGYLTDQGNIIAHAIIATPLPDKTAGG